MTWYAHHVFAAPAALPALVEAFPGHVFHVPDLARYRTTRREVDAITIGGGKEYVDVEVGPELPDGGLVVVRELCDPDDGPDWFDEADRVSWRREGDDDPEIPALDLRPAPPRATLAWLRALSRTTGTPVSLVCIMYWGGSVEYAHAWVFDPWGDRVYVETAPRRVRVIAPGGERVLVGGDALSLALVHHRVFLESFRFEPHTRSFPWADYQVPA